MFRRWVAATLVSVMGAVVLLANATAVQAGFGDPVNCSENPTNPSCEIQVGTPGDSNTGSGGSASGCRDPLGHAVPCFIEGKGWLGESGCYFQLATGTDLQLAELLGGNLEPPAHWYKGSCGDPAKNIWYADVTLLRAYTTEPGLQLLAQVAVRHLSLPPPTIRLSPAFPAPQVVLLPTWLWIDSGAWSARTATASAGGLAVTAVGTPTSVTWKTGDGATVTCGQGTAWTPDIDPAKASPDCGHVYGVSSRSAPGGVFTISATITWNVTWSGGGATGTEPTLTSTSTTQVRVAESAVVNTQ